MVVNGSRENDGSRIDNYHRVDLALAYEVKKGIKPYFRIDNLFGQSYEEIIGFTSPGFVAFGGVELSLDLF